MKIAVENVSPAYASELLKGNKYNRPLNKARVDYYATMMSEGKWQENGDTIAITPDGSLLNGQHRLHAVIKSGMTIPMIIVRGIEPAAFTTIDRGKGRSNSDNFNIAGIPDATQMASIVSRYLILKKGRSFIHVKYERGTSFSRTKLFATVDLLNEYYSKAELYDRACQYCRALIKKTPILTVSEAAAFYVYSVYDKKHAAEVFETFLALLCSGSMENNGIYLLHRKLMLSKLQAHHLSSTTKTMLFIKAWNAYVTGKEVKVLSWNEQRENKIKIL